MRRRLSGPAPLQPSFHLYSGHESKAQEAVIALGLRQSTLILAQRAGNPLGATPSGALPSPSRPPNAFSAAFVPNPRQSEARDAGRRAGRLHRPSAPPAPWFEAPIAFWGTISGPAVPEIFEMHVVSAPSLLPIPFSKDLAPVVLLQHPRFTPSPLHPALPALNGLSAKVPIVSVKTAFSRPRQPDFAVNHPACDTLSQRFHQIGFFILRLQQPVARPADFRPTSCCHVNDLK